MEENKINKSEIFRSPPAKTSLEQRTEVPATDLRINPKLSEVIAKYSDRIYLSDRKTNKVEN